MKQKPVMLLILDGWGYREKITDEALEKEYADIEGVTRRLVGSFNELKEKIHIFESGLDDKVIEVVKAALKDVVEKRTEETVLGGYFSKYSASEEKIHASHPGAIPLEAARARFCQEPCMVYGD